VNAALFHVWLAIYAGADQWIEQMTGPCCAQHLEDVIYGQTPS